MAVGCFCRIAGSPLSAGAWGGVRLANTAVGRGKNIPGCKAAVIRILKLKVYERLYVARFDLHHAPYHRGGFYENVPRMLPEGIVAKIEKKAVPVPPVFDLIAKTGKIPERDMYNTFNMGAGLVLAVAAEDVSRAVAAISAAGETAFVIGECTAGDKGVELV